MARIYISSTFDDLGAYRRAAAAALDKLEHTVVAMEDYVASDQRPLDRCLADVGRADLYVGIFAWRYGFIPDGQAKSITELELDHAEENGIPRLLFILDQKAAWPPQSMDSFTKENDPALIAALRQRMGKDRLASFFETPEQLATLVSIAVTVQLARGQLERITPAIVETPRLEGSAPPAILASLTGSDVVQLDLGDGTEWWSTRLLVLAALAADHTKVQRLVFVEDGDRYVGMAPPWTVRDWLGNAFPQLLDAYRGARRAPGGAPAMVLGEYLRRLQQLPEGEIHIKQDVPRASLYAWLGMALETESLSVQQKGELSPDLLKRINEFPHPFVPMVHDGRLVQVVDRHKLAARLAAAFLDQLP